jgi:predicted transcriptional regulator
VYGGISLSGRRAHRGNALTSKLESEIELLQRHVDMLKSIAENEPIGIIRLAEMMKCPQHKVRYSLRMLEQEELIEPSTGGAVTTKKVDEFMDELGVILDNMNADLKRVRESIV